jgi:hypothetical protein
MKTKIKTKEIMKSYEDYKQAQKDIEHYKIMAYGLNYSEDFRAFCADSYKKAEDSAVLAKAAVKNASAKLQTVLDEVQKRTTARNISVMDICEAIYKIDQRISIPKKYKKGVWFWYDCNAQTFPGAYKYTPESTAFKATFNGSEWIIEAVFRAVCTNKTCKVELTEEAKEKLISEITYF